jgi:crossover junction endodeoxyribonuclease RuvC
MTSPSDRRLVVGIDPGLSGAVAFPAPGSEVTVFDLPTHQLVRGGRSKREIDLAGLARLFSERAGEIRHVFVEQVGAMPGQGVSSVFAFGKAYGAVLGVVAASLLPLTLVPPRRWKRELRVPAAKDGARARASQLLPRAAGNWPLVKHDGRAEAALIALYGARQLGRVGS